MAALLEEREGELRTLHSDLQLRNSDITGQCDIIGALKKKVLFFNGNVSSGLVASGLRGELRAEEEKLKEKERERKDLEETVDLLRKELNKTEQARKEASIKVSTDGLM